MLGYIPILTILKKLVGAVQAVLFNYAQEIVNFDMNSRKDLEKLSSQDIEDKYDLTSNIKSRYRGNANLVHLDNNHQQNIVTQSTTTPFTPMSDISNFVFSEYDDDDDQLWGKL